MGLKKAEEREGYFFFLEAALFFPERVS